MQTKDHKMLVKFLIAEMGINIPYLYKKAFILGSIEPDKNPFTYLHGLTCGVKFHGHNYENVLSVMKKLFNSTQKKEHFGVLGYYHLGKLTHYVADAFTFPHNRMFRGNLMEHCKYESLLHEKFSDVLQKRKMINIRPKSMSSFHYIEILHKEYLKEAGTYEIDCRYILQAVAMLLWDKTHEVCPADLMQMEKLAG